jgi:hypothetical protein
MASQIVIYIPPVTIKGIEAGNHVDKRESTNVVSSSFVS